LNSLVELPDNKIGKNIEKLLSQQGCEILKTACRLLKVKLGQKFQKFGWLFGRFEDTKISF
jgi:hypothetical protein